MVSPHWASMLVVLSISVFSPCTSSWTLDCTSRQQSIVDNSLHWRNNTFLANQCEPFAEWGWSSSSQCLSCICTWEQLVEHRVLYYAAAQDELFQRPLHSFPDFLHKHLVHKEVNERRRKPAGTSKQTTIFHDFGPVVFNPLMETLLSIWEAACEGPS